MHDTTESRARPQEGIRSWCDAWNVWLTGRKELRLRIRFVQRLNEDTDEPTKGRSDGHRRHEDTSWDLTAI